MMPHRAPRLKGREQPSDWSDCAIGSTDRRARQRPGATAVLVPADAVSATVVRTSARSAVGSTMHACDASRRCRSTYDGIGLIKR